MHSSSSSTSTCSAQENEQRFAASKIKQGCNNNNSLAPAHATSSTSTLKQHTIETRSHGVLSSCNDGFQTPPSVSKATAKTAMLNRGNSCSCTHKEYQDAAEAVFGFDYVLPRPSSASCHCDGKSRHDDDECSAVIGQKKSNSAGLPCSRQEVLRLIQSQTHNISKSQQSGNQDGYMLLHQYRLMGQIGQGSYGIVKLAYNEDDKNLYAMKVLEKKKLLKRCAYFSRKAPIRGQTNQAFQVDPLERVQKEIAILKKLCHPNVVKLVEVLDDPSDKYLYMASVTYGLVTLTMKNFDILDSNSMQLPMNNSINRLILVFEYVERGCVLDIPTDSPFSEQEAWRYFRDTLQGLEYLHYQMVVHRDIKPSNLLLTEDNRIKIADFGVSSEFTGFDCLLSGTAGTPAFLAPEALIENQSNFYSGKAQDMWSLGITLYSFIYGNVPFWDLFVIQLHRKIKQDPVVFPDSPVTSDSVKDLVLGLLCKDPKQRLTLQATKEHAWVTRNGRFPLPSQNENCSLITVTDEEVRSSLRIMPKLGTLILVKAMVSRKSFCNPFRNGRNSHRQKTVSVSAPTDG